jgi:prepilin-type N-terminal cleavage/methylation domain-containing protein
MLNCSSQKGFSLIELLMVCVIVGLLATIAVPSMLQSREAAEKGATIANLRTIHSNQLTYMSQRGRYARIRELNTYFNNTLGKQVGTTTNARIIRGNYYYSSSPTPTDTTLRTRYQIYAYRLEGTFLETWFIMEQDGRIQTIVP